jgi:hypothetical protein
MAVHECPREADVLEALQTSAWPDCCGEDLRAHVAACQACAGLAEIAGALLDEHRQASLTAAVPSSATVWWRMQLRARREATERAMRPISVLQGLAIACGAGLLLAAIGFVSPTVRQFGSWLADLGGAAVGLGGASPVWADMQWFSPLGIAAVLAAALVLVVGPVAVYLSVRDR